MESDVAAIERLAGPEWAAAWNAGDAPAIAEFYAPDAVVFPNGSSPLAGKQTIEASFRSFLEESSVTGSSEIVELNVAGDWAYVRGVYTTDVRSKTGGEIVKDRGAWLWIVRRQPDSSWKIFRAMGASGPAAP